ncbi:MAG TPA: alpha/beta fold hydrolase [Thermoanaerobaculia bacterium]|nr:alpha/beta fold hydrolase [Thermoanaerobaculia bacterium]
MLLRAIRRSFPRLSRISPSLSARLAEILFRVPPPRHTRLKREQRALDEGAFSRTAFLARTLPTWTWGKGPGVLLVHGWGGHAGRLTPFVRSLLDAGFSVVAFDAPGHGIARGRVSSLPEFVAAIRAVTETHGPFHAVIGHSLGAAAAALAVRDGLGAQRLVLLAPPSDLERYTGRFARIMRIPPTVRDSMKKRLEKRFQIRWAELKVAGQPASADVSVLIFHDRRDARVPMRDGVEISHTWPNAKLVRTRGLGHHRLLRDARVISRAVAFLAGRPARRPDAARPRRPPTLAPLPVS